MPSLVKIRIERGRDLPPMDRNVNAEASTDAYVEIRLENQLQRTTTCRRTLNPVWNEDFQFEFIDDSTLQDTPLELKCMDHDLYSSELIGVVNIDLNPLIMRTTQGADKDLIISGWFPLFDTARGVRGSLLVTVKLQFIGNENPFRDSSAGIQFFTSSALSNKCFFIQEIIGFVEELVVEDDPENSWQDYFLKGNKTSNDNRLRVLYNLSAEVRRKLGKKAFECGGNAVLGYSFHFDTEGAAGIVARACGTACRLLKADESTSRSCISRMKFDAVTNNAPDWTRLVNSSCGNFIIPRETAEKLGFKFQRNNAGTGSSKVHDGAVVLVQAKPYSHTIVGVQMVPFSLQRESAAGMNRHESLTSRHGHGKGDYHHNSDAWNIPNTHAVDSSLLFQQVEVQLLTMRAFPSHVQVKLGGLVLARSVKYFGKNDISSADGQDTLTDWWQELREEIKSHAKTLCCRYVIGYSETCAIHGDVCILSAMGTAASLKGLGQSPQMLLIPNYSPPGESFYRSPPSNKKDSVAAAGSGGMVDSDDGGGSVDDDVLSPIPHLERRQTNQSAGDNSIISHGGGGSNSSRRRSASSSDHAADEEVRGILIHQHSQHSQHHNSDGHHHHHNHRKRNRRNKRRMCTATHVPYNHNTAPFAFMRLVPCLLCKRKWVPETILSTTELPAGLPVRGKGRLLEAKVCRTRKGASGEADAVKISEVLPFLEYDIQRQITLKLKVLGINAAFGYSCQIHVSNDVVVATAHCTGVYLLSLPAPPPLLIMRSREGRGDQDARLVALQRELDMLSSIYKDLADQQELQSIQRQQSLAGGVGAGGSLRTGSHHHNSHHNSRSNTLSSSMKKKSTSHDVNEDTITTNTAAEEKGGEIGSVGSRSRSSSSSTSSSSSSSSSEDDHGGDDISSLASPSSSSSSSSSSTSTPTSSSESESGGASDEEKDTFDDGINTPLETATISTAPDPTITTTLSAGEASMAGSSSKRHRAPSHSSGLSDKDMMIRKQPSNKSRSSKEDKMTTATASLHIATSTKERKSRKIVFRDDRAPYILEVDDETDSDIISVLMDFMPPLGFDMVNLSKVPGRKDGLHGVGRYVSVLRRSQLLPNKGTPAYLSSLSNPATNSFRDYEVGPTSVLNKLFHEAYIKLCYSLKSMVPCEILNMSHHINVVDDGQVEILITAMVHKVVTSDMSRSLRYHAGSIADSEISGNQEWLQTESSTNVHFTAGQWVTPRVDNSSNNPTESIGNNKGIAASQSPKPAAMMARSTSFETSQPLDGSSGGGPSNQTIKSRGRAVSNSSCDSLFIGLPSEGSHDLPNITEDESHPNSLTSSVRTAYHEASASSSIRPSSKLETIEESIPLPSGTMSMSSVMMNQQFAPASSSPILYPESRHMSMSSTVPEFIRMSSAPSRKHAGSVSSMAMASAAVNPVAIAQVLLTPLPRIPGTRIKRHLGLIQLHFIKDSWSARGEDSLGSYAHLVLSEVNALARAHVAALGGNALLCYNLVPQEAGGRVARSQGFTMFSVTGDAVSLEFHVEANQGLPSQDIALEGFTMLPMKTMQSI
eukprot:gene8189-9036_t